MPISAAGFLINPSLVAEHTNGIHTTRLYGTIDSKIYPSIGESDTFDRQAGIIQTYEAMRDLIFTFQGDYTHRTIATLFQNRNPWSSGWAGEPAATYLGNGAGARHHHQKPIRSIYRDG